MQDFSQKTNEMAGGSPTTSTCSPQHHLSKGVKNVAAGCKPMDLQCGSQATVDHIEFPAINTKTITITAEIAQVTTISANGDVPIGTLVAQVIGKEGVSP